MPAVPIPERGPLLCTNCAQSRRFCACVRCLLIGDPIRQPGAVVYRVRFPTHYAPPGYLEREGKLIGPPLRLNVHPLHGGSRGVGLAFSGQMHRYLDAAMRELGVRERRELSEWWESDYGVRRVRAGLHEMLPAARASHVLALVLAVAREDATPEEVADEQHVTVAWLARWAATCQRLADRPAGQTFQQRPRYHKIA